MGCGESAIDEQTAANNPITVAERHKSLIEFVRALSEPTFRCTSNELSKNTKRNTIGNVEELTPSQEEFISRYKMRVYSCLGDPVGRASTFNIIENEFYNTYHKQVDRKVLYSVLGIH